jgi:hypothetical protein
MIYVLDTNSFRVLENYYPATFPSFWDHFNAAVTDGRCTSVAEVEKELERYAARQHLIDWIEEHKSVFTVPPADEMAFVAEIFAVPHFQGLVGTQQLTVGTPVADPWIIAKLNAAQGLSLRKKRRNRMPQRYPTCVSILMSGV